jgi:hydroxypyruvate isomerase
MLFAPNLSMLWADLPLADRFERAARAGFRAVELWWPGTGAAESLPGLTARWNLRLALLNFDAGEMAAGTVALPPIPGAGSGCEPACRPRSRWPGPAGANG